jgi:hypothetical protein
VGEIENHEPCEETPSTSGTRVERRGICTKSELSDAVKQGSLKLQKLTLISSLFPPPKYPDKTTTFHPPILSSLHKHSTPIWYFIFLFRTSYLLGVFLSNLKPFKTERAENVVCCFEVWVCCFEPRKPRMFGLWFLLKFSVWVCCFEPRKPRKLCCGFC